MQLVQESRTPAKGSVQNWIKQRPAKKDIKRTSKIRNLKAKSWLDVSSDNENQPVLCFNNTDRSITVQLNGQRTQMIVDTGCKYNIISSKLYQSQFKNYNLNTTEKQFTAYEQKEPLKCKGYFNATIRVHDTAVSSHVYVIEGNAESLLGQDSSFKLRVLTQVNSVHQQSDNAELNSLLKEYSNIFHGLGKVNEFEHKIAIDLMI